MDHFTKSVIEHKSNIKKIFFLPLFIQYWEEVGVQVFN